MFRKERRPFRLPRPSAEAAAVFAISFAAYGALGARLVLQQHLVVFDALTRLSHAYFVWYNEPPKLTAVGFVWPPIATLVFLPLAAIKPLATSLLALPLTSALFAAGLFVVLNRLFTLVGMSRLYRFTLLVAFGVNPLVAFYASNGMSEIVYLFFLVASTYFFFRWYLSRAPGMLVVASLLFSLGILSRYEVITWAIVVTAVIAAALIRQQVSRAELEGTMIAYLAPVSYGVSLWLFFNWLILNDALFFLKQQAPGGTGGPGREGQGTVIQVSGERLGVGDVLGRLVELNWNLFPLTIIVLLLLVALAASRRDLMATALAVILSLNALFTALIVIVSRAESYLQLRYNMRAMPLTLVGVAWLFLYFRDRSTRRAIWAGSLAVILTSIPLTWRTMETYPIQYLEQAFTRAVATGDDLEGTGSLGGYGVGIAPQRQMADYIESRIARTNDILTDDAQTFSVMLLTGRPDIFFDRIDEGDSRWLAARDDPWGRVRYLLVSISPNDLVLQKYPALQDGALPGLTPVRRESGLLLVRVSPRRPPAMLLPPR